MIKPQSTCEPSASMIYSINLYTRIGTGVLYFSLESFRQSSFHLALGHAPRVFYTHLLTVTVASGAVTNSSRAIALVPSFDTHAPYFAVFVWLYCVFLACSFRTSKHSKLLNHTYEITTFQSAQQVPFCKSHNLIHVIICRVRVIPSN